MTSIDLSLEQIARALDGEVRGNQVLAPGPGHSAKDRSLSIKLEESAPGGFLVYSFSGDDPILCKEYVRGKLGLAPWSRNANRPPKAPAKCHDAKRAEAALAIWAAAKPADGTVVETYLASRETSYPTAADATSSIGLNAPIKQHLAGNGCAGDARIR